MKKILIPLFVLTFVCSAALAGKDGATPKGHDCPFAKAEKDAGMKPDCPDAAAMAEKGGAKKPDCPMMAKAAKAAAAKKCGGMCPEKLKGVEKTVKNTETGVQITFTAKDKETIAKVQEMIAAKAGAKNPGEKDCACKVEGSETKVTNTESGVVMQVTGATPEMIKKIQAASTKEHKCGEGEKAKGKHGAKKAAVAKKYICPMKCAESDKPGKCPKCGMALMEKK